MAINVIKYKHSPLIGRLLSYLNGKIGFLIFFLSAVFFLSNYTDSNAQFQFNIDSLTNILSQTPENSTKVDLYLDLSREYRSLDKESQFWDYLKKGEALANKLNYKEGIIKSKYIYGGWYFSKNQYDKALEITGQVLEQSEKASYPFGKVMANLTYASYYNYYADTIDLDKSLEYLNKAVSISEESKDTLLLILSLLDLGYYQSNLGKYKESILIFQRSVSLAKQTNALGLYISGLNLLGLSYYEIKEIKTAIEVFNTAFELLESKNERYYKALVYNNLGICFSDIGLFDKATESYLEALEISIEFKDSVGITTDLFNLADVYLQHDMFDKSLEYYTKSLDISERIKSNYDIAYSYNGLAEYYLKTKDYPKALDYYNKSILLWEKLDDKIRIAENYYGLGDTKKKMRSFKESLDFYNKALAIYKESDLKSSVGSVQNEIGELYLLQKNYTAAEENLKSAYNNLHLLEAKAPLIGTYKFLSRLYQEKNDFENAFFYQQKYSALKDTFYNREKKNKIIGAEIKFELAEKSRENELLKKENQIQNLELEKTSNMQLYLTIISVMALLITAAVFYSYRTKAKANKNLSILNGTKDKFISIISHDIKNPIYSIMAYSDLMVSDYENFSSGEVYESLVTINNSSKNLHKYLNDILTWQNAQKNKLKINQDKFNLYEMVERVFSNHNLNARQKDVALLNEVDRKMFVLADRYMIEVIMTNLINNAIKFSNPGGQVAVMALLTGSKVEISVVDNGIGIPKEDIPKLFRIDVSYSNKGTQGEEGTGLGLILCKEFVEKNGGEIRVDSTPGQGSSFSFTLPAIA